MQILNTVNKKTKQYILHGIFDELWMSVIVFQNSASVFKSTSQGIFISDETLYPGHTLIENHSCLSSSVV